MYERDACVCTWVPPPIDQTKKQLMPSDPVDPLQFPSDGLHAGGQCPIDHAWIPKQYEDWSQPTTSYVLSDTGPSDSYCLPAIVDWMMINGGRPSTRYTIIMIQRLLYNKSKKALQEEQVKKKRRSININKNIQQIINKPESFSLADTCTKGMHVSAPGFPHQSTGPRSN